MHRIHHLGFSVRDLSTAVDLTRSLGFEEVSRFDLGGNDMARGNGLLEASAKIALLQSESLLIELLEFGIKATPVSGTSIPARVRLPVANHSRMNSVLGHNAFRSESKGTQNAILERRLDELGLPFMATDSSQFKQPKPQILSPTVDAERARDLLTWLGFAGVTSGFVFERTDLIVELAITGDSDNIEVPPNRIGRLHIAVEVADIDKAWTDLTEAGFTFVSRPIRSKSVAWVFVRAPLGIGLELVELSDSLN